MCATRTLFSYLGSQLLPVLKDDESDLCHSSFFFLIDNKNFIEEKEQCVYDCKLITLETNTIKSKRESNREKEIRQ